MFQLRAARSTDAGKLGAMISDAVTANTWKPRLHSGAQDIAHMGDLIDRGWVTVCEQGGQVAGFLARDRSAVQSLYVQRGAQGLGIGALLLNDAKAASGRLELWTFQANVGAQRFYLRHGFAEVERTDGSGNEEGLPDIRYVWVAPTDKATEESNNG
jgi:GNAT superfamily N-acetyltransferase